MSRLTFDGRVAIVTGAGGNPGLGRSYARLLAERGAKVLVNDLGVGPDGRSAVSGNAEIVAAEIRAEGGEALSSGDSVAARDGAARIIQSAIEAWGRVDIIINNAGIAPFALFDEISDTDIEKVIAVHMMGPIWMARAAWGHMVKQGYGRIVNVSSGVGLVGVPYQTIYSAAKLGVIGLTRGLAAEGGRHGILVNAILPAADTLAWQTMLEPQFSESAVQQGLLPDVVAPAAAWLAHESCSVSGKGFNAAAGALYEVFFSRTLGTAPDPNLTLEDVAARVPEAFDRSRREDFGEAAWNTPPGMVPRPYTP